MARQDLAERAAELRAARVAFVHARVVLAERPTSARAGDEAIVLADGTIEGFVGGTCAEATVRDQALERLRDAEPGIVRISAAEEPPQPGKQVVRNPCLSGGTLEVFLEPFVAPRVLVVAGEAPIARALRSLGAALGYEARPWGGALGSGTEAVVVATHGRDEEAVVIAALLAEVPYVGLVASARRGAAVLAALDMPPAARARVHTPAGLDIGARRPEEVALSILAEMVACRAARRAPGTEQAAVTASAARATDPVCGMTVFPAHGALHVEHAGSAVWFCGRGCLEAFVADPGAHTATPTR